MHVNTSCSRTIGFSAASLVQIALWTKVAVQATQVHVAPAVALSLENSMVSVEVLLVNL